MGPDDADVRAAEPAVEGLGAGPAGPVPEGPALGVRGMPIDPAFEMSVKADHALVRAVLGAVGGGLLGLLSPLRLHSTAWWIASMSCKSLLCPDMAHAWLIAWMVDGG